MTTKNLLEASLLLDVLLTGAWVSCLELFTALEPKKIIELRTYSLSVVQNLFLTAGKRLQVISHNIFFNNAAKLLNIIIFLRLKVSLPSLQLHSFTLISSILSYSEL